VHKIAIACLLLAALLGCGGGGSSSTPPPTLPSSGGGTPSSVTAPSVVQVAAGATASGVDISVPAPSGAQPNALDLGVAPLTGPGSASNTGDVIHRGAIMRVVLFGPGLSGDMQVSILGPNDIQISNVQGATATDNTPGITFTAAVAVDAALGARTVVLQTSSGNITTFTGGLEVVP
jgi:hypothetical protein